MQGTTRLKTKADAPTEGMPEWAPFWHVWTLFIPRRCIEGGFAWGRVWRRHDGRRWVYARLFEADTPPAPRGQDASISSRNQQAARKHDGPSNRNGKDPGIPRR